MIKTDESRFPVGLKKKELTSFLIILTICVWYVIKSSNMLPSVNRNSIKFTTSDEKSLINHGKDEAF